MPTQEPTGTSKLSFWRSLSLVGKIFGSVVATLGGLAALLVGLQALGFPLSFLPHVETDPSPSVVSSPDPPPPPSVASDRGITEARIEIAERNLVGPKTIGAGKSPGFEPFVFTAAGRLGRTDPCNVSWKVFNNSDLVYTKDTRCEKQGGFSEEFWPSDLSIEPGTMKVVAAVTTKWGASKTAELILKVK